MATFSRAFLRDRYPSLRGLGVACYAEVFAVGGSVTKKHAQIISGGKSCTLPLTFQKSCLECAGSKVLPQLLRECIFYCQPLAWHFMLKS